MDAAGARRRRLADAIRSEIGSASGRRYAINLDALDERSLKELLRLLRDLDDEMRAAVNRARLAPWRKP